MRVIIYLTCLFVAYGPAGTSAESCGCARPDLINVFNQALHSVTAAPGSIAVLPFSVDESEARGKLSVRIPKSFRSCFCGGSRYLRYHFPITDVVGSIGRGGWIWSAAERGCFNGAQTLQLGPGSNPDLTIDVYWSEGSRRPHVDNTGAPSKLELLQVGRWRSWNAAYESRCSFLYTSTYMDLRDAFRGWMAEIERRLGNLPTDLTHGNSGSSSEEPRDDSNSSQED